MEAMFYPMIIAMMAVSAANLTQLTNNTICNYVPFSQNTTCYVDCSIQNCDYAKIDGYGFSDLTVDCSNATCKSMYITCPKLANNCSLICGDTESCAQTVVTAGSLQIDQLNVECSGAQSCEDLTVYIDRVDPIEHLNFDFSQTSAMPMSVISRNSGYDPSITSLTLQCTNLGCAQLVMNMDATPIGSAYINCTDDRSCEAVSWSFTMQGHMDVDWGTNSFQYPLITVNLLNIGYLSNVLEPGSLDFNCIGCRTLSLFVNGDSSAEADPLLPNKVNVNCQRCRKGYNKLYKGFNFQDVHTTFHCAKDGCWNKIINAANANYFQLECDGNSSCLNTDVYCPSYRVGACDIECGYYDQSCVDMKVYADNEYTAGYVDLNCSYDVAPEEQCGIGFHCLKNSMGEAKLPVNVTWNAKDNLYECTDLSSDYCCPNGEDENRNTEKSKYDATTWFIIGVVFIVAFCIVFAVLLEFGYLANKRFKAGDYEAVKKDEGTDEITQNQK